MVQNILEVFSLQEKKVYILRHKDGKSIKEIAEELKCSNSTVKTYLSRIKKKITELELMHNVTIDYNVSGTDTEIDDIFDEEQSRCLPKKTVNQVQFLSESTRMSCKKRSPEATRQMRVYTGTANTMTTRIMSDIERANLQIIPSRRPDSSVTSAYKQYNNLYSNPPDIETMASLEIILRANGLIFRTPYINKLNRKTSQIMRAQESGFQAMIVEPGESKTIPPGSKFIESVKDNEGHHEYSVWLFPKNFCPRIKQKSKNTL